MTLLVALWNVAGLGTESVRDHQRVFL